MSIIEDLEEKVAKLCDERIHAAEGMIKFGGSFTRNLGHALMKADIGNTKKIKEAFPKEWEEHKNLWLAFKERENNE